MESAPFSEREKQVIELLVQGQSNKQIALALGVSRRTVEYHLSNIYAKLGVTSRTEAALRLSQAGLRESAGANLRESTVSETDEAGDNVKETSWTRRIPVNKSSVVGIGILILTSIFCYTSIFSMAKERSLAEDMPDDPVRLSTVASTSEAVHPTTAVPPSSTVVPQPANVVIPPHTVNGYTATIESYSIGISQLLFQVRITGGETAFGNENFYSRFKDADLYDPHGNEINTSGGWGPAVDPALIEFHFTPVTLFQGDRFQGQFAFDLLDAPNYDETVAQFRFDLDLPIYPEIRFSPKQTVSTNGLEMLFDSLTVTPTFTQAYLCFRSPSFAPWHIGSQTLLQLDGQEASLHDFMLLFDSDLGGDKRAGSEPYWVPPTKTGRCMKVGFPIGSSDPTSLTLTIPELENLDPEVLMTDRLLTDYPGLDPKEAYSTYLEEHGRTYKGPWTFTMELAR